MVELNLLAHKEKLKFKKERNTGLIFGEIRKKYLVLGPEEMVRQLIILHLIEDCHFNKNRIAVEKQLIVNELKKRCDILVFDSKMKPFLLIECKAPDVPITEDTFRQIAWYNMPLKVPFLMVSNGIYTFICKMDYERETFDFISKVPEYQ